MPNVRTWKCEGTYNASHTLNIINSMCMGNQSCTIDTDEFMNRLNGPQVCIEDTAQFFVQAYCYHDDKSLETRTFINQILCFEVVVVVLLFLGFVFYMNNKLSQKYVEWDKNMTTISDYACKYEIPKDLYLRFV